MGRLAERSYGVSEIPLEQSGKVRPIDELSQSQVNATVTVFEQVTLDGPDVICAFAFFMMKCLGGEFYGKEHLPSGKGAGSGSAYRQLAIADESFSGGDIRPRHFSY